MVFVGCGSPQESPAPPSQVVLDDDRANAAALALAPLPLEHPRASQVARLQQRVREGGGAQAGVDLAWAFVGLAREDEDPGYWLQATAAASPETQAPGPAGNDARVISVLALLQAHRFREGTEAARALTASHPGDSRTWMILGDALMETGLEDEGLSAWQKSMDLHPGAPTYVRAAWWKEETGDIPSALKLARLAVEATSPEERVIRASLLAFLGGVEARQGNPSRAEAWFREAQALHPHGSATVGLARCLWARGEVNEAERLLREALERRPGPELAWVLGDLLSATSRSQEALGQYSLVERMAGLSSRRLLSRFLAERDPQRALALAREEWAERGDQVARDLLAWTLLQGGFPQQAEVLIKQVLARGSRAPERLYHAAAIALAQGDPGRARVLLTTVLARGDAWNPLLASRCRTLLASLPPSRGRP